MLDDFQGILDDKEDQGHLFDLVRARVGIVSEVMQRLRGNLRRKVGVPGEEIKEEEIQIEIEGEKSNTASKTPNKTVESSKFILNEINGVPIMAFKSVDEPNASDIGHFIPLNCGHNGYFSAKEKA